MSTVLETIAPPVRFHLSLNVADLSRSVHFYRLLFGCEPAKLRADYAKFELDEPPLVLSLEPTPRGEGGALNHLGFRMAEMGPLVAMQERLARAGIHTEREEGVECCYARQTKFWVHDPDRTLWEVYTLEEDIDHRGSGQLPEKVLSAPTVSTPETATKTPSIWEHFLGQPVPDRLPHVEGSLDEVRLRGSLNKALTSDQIRHLLSTSVRMLRAGGKLFIHVLTADKAIQGNPGLAGPAAVVESVPVDRELIALLENSGVENIRVAKFASKPCFLRDGVAMRETRIEAWKPANQKGSNVTVVYRGPFSQLVDDAGTVYQRGQRVEVSSSKAEHLMGMAGEDAFTLVG